MSQNVSKCPKNAHEKLVSFFNFGRFQEHFGTSRNIFRGVFGRFGTFFGSFFGVFGRFGTFFGVFVKIII